MGRFLLVVYVVVVKVVALVVGVVMAGGSGGPGAPRVPALVPPPAVGYVPAGGTNDVSPRATVTAFVANGTFTDVALRGPGGRPVAGEFNAERTAWTVREPLGYGQAYTWRGTAAGTDGTLVRLAGSFTTARPEQTVRARINIDDGTTVGIAAPIAIRFEGPVRDRAAVERALSVRTSVPVEGSWAWLPADSNGELRVHWRPREYWPPGTRVTVTADLYGVHYGDGAFGAKNITRTFTIGRPQIVKADVNTHRMIVIRDGRQVADFPASYGSGSHPATVTRSGIHVVSAMYKSVRMASPRFGYDGMYASAVLISANGEFIHANPESLRQQGRVNVTHGCVNLSPKNARTYFNMAMYGDPVVVTGTSIPLSLADGDYADWTFRWEAWQRLSALR
ncbi:L,D-transpeptidase LdtMt5 [Pseudonocardia aurantiaca]|uniref:Ig-like domain-containing protein n=1 Tax=Pseudonocardia aurantiaca TaxID=75290 RepID=A0ABW4FHI6_9PSEU